MCTGTRNENGHSVLPCVQEIRKGTVFCHVYRIRKWEYSQCSATCTGTGNENSHSVLPHAQELEIRIGTVFCRVYRIRKWEYSLPCVQEPEMICLGRWAGVAATWTSPSGKKLSMPLFLGDFWHLFLSFLRGFGTLFGNFWIMLLSFRY